VHVGGKLARTAATLLLALAPLTWSPDALSQARDPKRAEELFQEGKRQYEANDLATACNTLAQSDQLDPAIGTHGLLAACFEKQGKLAKALTAYRETQSRAQKAGDNREAYAKERGDALEAQVPRLKVTSQGNESGLSLTADGNPINPGDSVALDPGEHVVVARAPGKKDYELRVVLQAGARIDKTIPALVDADSGAAAAPTTTPDTLPPPADTNTDPGSGRRTAGLVLGGVGLAGIVVGSIFGLLTFSAASDANGLVDEGTDEEGYNAKRSDVDTFGMVSNIGFIAGGALLVGGAILYFTAPDATVTTGRAPANRTARVRVLPAAGPRGGGAFVTGAF
jgi:hypothetical protein